MFWGGPFQPQFKRVVSRISLYWTQPEASEGGGQEATTQDSHAHREHGAVGGEDPPQRAQPAQGRLGNAVLRGAGQRSKKGTGAYMGSSSSISLCSQFKHDVLVAAFGWLSSWGNV